METIQENQPKRVRTRAADHDDPQRLFACPYYKHNPTKLTYQRVCCGPGWNSIHRVKYDVPCYLRFRAVLRSLWKQGTSLPSACFTPIRMSKM
ncbi:hypothetical protein F5B18DRAFT_348664 [Nemania serpens]|nr:hypothetical protein F5B18DRAFT_348664 [Nemania serpens]